MALMNINASIFVNAESFIERLRNNDVKFWKSPKNGLALEKFKT